MRRVPETKIQKAASRLRILRELERKVLWLATWTIHHANHLRPHSDGLKVGGHQASCASVATLMTALYFDVLRSQDRVAVKPHASPIFHAIQYLLGRQTREGLELFRGLGGAQSYPSRTKDTDDVDFSTGSVGLGAAITLFGSMVQDYVRNKGWSDPNRPPGRMVALVGDAELDEGNVFEALLEGWKHNVRNVWWVIDYNRQSLDAVVEDRIQQRFDTLFESMGWKVITLKYGQRLEAAFARPDGEALREWIDDCPNLLYSALVYKGGAGWREVLADKLGHLSGIRKLLSDHDDASLHALMTNLGGHDMETVLNAFHTVEGDQPTCFIAYTVKGYGLPFAGHKDNHAGLMNPEQMAAYQRAQAVLPGQEWDPLAGLDLREAELRTFLAQVEFSVSSERRFDPPRISVPDKLAVPHADVMSTQEGFGRLLSNLGKESTDLAARLVTTAPDVTVSTNLGGWVNRRGLYDHRARADVFREQHVLSAQKWAMSPAGQHIELGIAENNFFLLLAAFGLSGSLFDARTLPIGALYDPFIARGLDALNYACYQDARFILVGTPSGLALAPEGGAHQSISTPLVGMGQPGLVAFEPAYVVELAEILRWSFAHLQDEDGSSVYLRLSTRPLTQLRRELNETMRRQVVDGGYWHVVPERGAELVLVCCGAVTPEALEAYSALRDDIPGIGLLSVTSADRLHAGWLSAQRRRQAGEHACRSHVELLLSALDPHAAMVTVIDGHPATLSWLGSVAGHRVVPLGAEQFGQSGDVLDLYEQYRLNAQAILDAAARAFLDE